MMVATLRRRAALLLLAILLPAAPAGAVPARSCAAPAELLRLPDALPRTASRLTAHGALHIVALGSSSTAGTGASSPARTYPSQLLAELRRRLPGERIEVANKGVGGETSVEMLARFDRDVFPLSPDLVIWQVGTNAILRDDDLGRDLEIVRNGVQRLKSVGIDIVLMDMQYAPRVLSHPLYPAMEKGLATIAKSEGVSVFHRFAIMKHWTETKQLDFATMLAPDQLHMNDVSYGCIGQLLATAIIERTTAPVLTSHR